MSNIIEKQIVLKAPVDRVWRAISDPAEFGSWFGMRIEGPFVAGTKVTGTIRPTTVNEEVAAAQKPHEGKAFSLLVETIEPQTRFAFRWHPYAVDPDTDYSKEPTTLVSFVLRAVDDGTHLTVTESGFENIPEHRRAEAMRMNDGGWTAQMGLIEAYLAR